ncbi:PAS domain-containing sensor histidine kinase [Chloroflexota bacterium]
MKKKNNGEHQKLLQKKQSTKQAQERTQMWPTEESYRDLFENAYDALWVHDLEGNMVTTNKACETLTGYSSEELMNVEICRRMSGYSQSCIEQVELGLLQHRPVDHVCEGELVKKGREKAIIQITTSLVEHEGQAVGFQHCAREVTEERQSQRNLHYYLQQVTLAQEEERKRIARELHDETVQSLVTISRRLDKIISSDALWEESLETVRSFKKQVEIAVQGIRRFSRDLRPSVLDDLGLLSALEMLADDLEKDGVVTRFEVIGGERRFVPELEVMLFRIAQEAMRNIWRHAQASVAELVIDFRDSKVRLSIRDNGKGFSLPRRPGDLAGLGKLGLAGMHERAMLLGGNLILESNPAKGTKVIVEVPT